MFNLAKISLAAAAMLASTSAFAATPDWRVSEVSGTVTVERAGKKITVKQNSTLKAGDVITTGAKGRAVLVRGKEFVVISPKARLQVADPKKTGAVTQWFQYIGNALFKVEKKTTPHFGVKTPYLAAVVKGTTFNVSVSDQNTSVQVTEGMVEVATDDNLEAALITPGLIGLVNAANAHDLVVVVGDGNRDYSGAAVRGAPEFVTKVPRSGVSESAFSVAPGLSAEREEKSNRSSSEGEERERGSVAKLDDDVSGGRGDDNSDDAGERSANGRDDWSKDDQRNGDNEGRDRADKSEDRGGERGEDRADDRDDDRGDEGRERSDGFDRDVDFGRDDEQEERRGGDGGEEREGRDGRGRDGGPDDRGGDRPGEGGDDIAIGEGRSGELGEIDLDVIRDETDLDLTRGLDGERGRERGGRGGFDDDDEERGDDGARGRRNGDDRGGKP